MADSKKVRKWTAYTFIGAVFLFALDLYLYRLVMSEELNEREKLEVNLAGKAKTGASFLLREVTSFKWSKVCVIYSTDDSSDKVPSIWRYILGGNYQFRNWQQAIPNPIPFGNEYSLAFVFISDNEVVQVLRRGGHSFVIEGVSFLFNPNRFANRACSGADAAKVKVKKKSNVTELTLFD
ncbi:MAG: hypothetical protein ACAH83_19335 [Alphaproteobacteria bacterium]